MSISAAEKTDKNSPVSLQTKLKDFLPKTAPDPRVKIRKQKLNFIKENGDLVINNIQYEGLLKTKEIVIQQWLKVNKGDLLSKFSPCSLYDHLVKLRIFSLVKFSYKKSREGVDIVIGIKEKWTLYPIPMIIFYQNLWVFGIILAETNLWGYNKGIFGGAFHSSRGDQYLAGWVDPNVAFTDTWLSVSLFGGNAYIVNARSNGDVFQAYNMTRYDFQYSLGYTLWGVFSPTWTGSFRSINVDKNHPDSFNAPDGGDVISQGIKFIYSDLKNRFYYDKGFRTSIEFQKGLPIGTNGLDFYNIQFDARYTTESIKDHTISLAFYAAYADMPAVMEHRLGGLESTRVLPAASIAADKYASATIIYQTPFFKFNKHKTQFLNGTATLLTFFEYGKYIRNNGRLTRFYGPGLGIRYYLKNVSFPALGSDVAYEIKTRSIYFSFAVGFRPTR